MRSKLALLVLIASFVPLLARADDASKMAKIHEFFKVAKLDQLSTQAADMLITQVKTRLSQESRGVTLNADQQQKYDEFLDKLSNIARNAVSWPTLEPEYAKLYANTYTEQEIDDMLAFYKSPTGQVMVEKTPMLMQQANAIAQQHTTAVIPQIQRLVREYRQPSVNAPPQDDPNQEQ